jgi:dihydrofolate reductase
VTTPSLDEEPAVRIIITQNVTLDGRVEMLDDWFDPQAQDDELSAELMRQSANEDVLLLGRQTFEDFRGYWPLQTNDTTGVAAQLDQVDKRVVSRTLTEPGWQNTQIISSDPMRAVAALRDEPGRDVIVTGSISLAHELISEGLVDEYRMFTYPVWQGRGRGYFRDGAHSARPPRLRLIDSKAFSSGIVYSAYEPTS